MANATTQRSTQITPQPAYTTQEGSRNAKAQLFEMREMGRKRWMGRKQMTKVTELQNEYLLLLKDGPKTTRELADEVDRSMAAANKIIKKLSNKKLVTIGTKQGGRGLTYLYTLTKPYDEMVLEITANATGNPIPEEEILYAAILRNGILVGQRLTDQYQKLYPHRTRKSIGNIVGTARRRRLC